MRESRRFGRTRRDVLATGTALGGAVLAGCVSGTERENGGDDASTDGDDAIEACIEPSGCLEFDAPPETYVTYKEAWAEMAVALGKGDGLAGTDLAKGGQDRLNELFYAELEGLEFPTEGVTDLRGGGENVDQEVFYELDADVHLMDPNLPRIYFEWEDDDTDAIADQVAPFFGSYIRRERDEQWGDYEFYSLYDAFEQVAILFDEYERYEAFAQLHEEFLEDVRSRLPPESERPSLGLLNGGTDPAQGSYYVMDPTAPGYEMKQYRDLGIENAFEGAELGENGETDVETLLEYDPDQLAIHWGVTLTDDEFREQYVDPMEADAAAGSLTAVENGRLLRGGTAEQGPITNLFQTELLAKEQYPDVFDEDEALFDRDRIVEIASGDL